MFKIRLLGKKVTAILYMAFIGLIGASLPSTINAISEETNANEEKTSLKVPEEGNSRVEKLFLKYFTYSLLSIELCILHFLTFGKENCGFGAQNHVSFLISSDLQKSFFITIISIILTILASMLIKHFDSLFVDLYGLETLASKCINAIAHMIFSFIFFYIAVFIIYITTLIFFSGDKIISISFKNAVCSFFGRMEMHERILFPFKNSVLYNFRVYDLYIIFVLDLFNYLLKSLLEKYYFKQ